MWLLRAGALPLFPGPEAFAGVKWWTVWAYTAIWIAVHLVRSLRWHWLLAPIHRVSLRKVLTVSTIGFAAILLMPLRTGEIVRPVLIRQQGKLTAWEATGTVAAERIIDGLMLSALLFIALQLATPLDPLPDHIGALPVPVAVVPGAAYSALILFTVAFVVMGAFYWRRAWARRLVENVLGLISLRLAAWLATRIEQVAAGLRFLPQTRFALPFVLATALYWLLNAAGAWLLAWGCGFTDITFAQACTLVGVLALGILLPNAPGFFGAFQISVYAGFAMYFPAEKVVTAGAAYVFLLYLIQVATTLAGALVAAVVERVDLSNALRNV